MPARLSIPAAEKHLDGIEDHITALQDAVTAALKPLIDRLTEINNAADAVYEAERMRA